MLVLPKSVTKYVPDAKPGLQVSVTVLVRLNGQDSALKSAIFNHVTKRWHLLNHIPSRMDYVSEWWPIPELFSGIPADESLEVR